MLNTDSERRYDITELRLSPWMRGLARPLTPYPHTKITDSDYLPPSLPRWETISSDLSSMPLPSSPGTGPHRPTATGVVETPVGPDRKQQPSSMTPVSVKRRQKEGKKRNHHDHSIRTKISSASKKLVHSFIHRPSSSRTESAI